MGTLGSAVISFSADTAKFTSDLGKVAAQFQQVMSRMQSGMAGLARAGALLGTIGSLGLLVKGSVDAADRLNDLSKATMIAGVELGGLGFAASQSGSSLEGVSSAIGRMQRNVALALSGNADMVRVFQNLGVSVEDLRRLNPTELFARLADAFSSAEDGANKAGHGAKVFGKAYMEILPTLEEGGERIRKNIDYYKQYSGVTEDLIRRSDEFNDQLVKLGLLSKAFGNTLASALLDPLRLVVDEMIRFREGMSESSLAVSAIVEPIKALGTGLMTVAAGFQIAGIAAAAAKEAWKNILSFGDPETMTRLRKQAIEEMDAVLQELANRRKRMEATFVPAPAFEPHTFAWSGKASLPDLPNEKALESLYKRQASALEQMEGKKGALFNLTEEELMLNRVLAGSYKDFNAETKVRLLNFALEIDARKNLIYVADLQLAATLAMDEQQRASNDILQQSIIANARQNEDAQFALSLTGKSIIEQERLNALRQIDLTLRDRLHAAAAAAKDDEELFGRTAARLEQEAERQRAATLKHLEQRQALEEDWRVGAKKGMEDYIESSRNVARQMESFTVNAFKGMEDALVDFVMTGKLNFEDFAKAVIADLIRIQIRAALAAAATAAIGDPKATTTGGSGLFGAIGQGFLSLFGGGGGAAAGATAGSSMSAGFGVFATGTDYVPRDMLALIHQGEAIIPASENHDGSGPQVYIDARGADAAAVQRLEATVRAMNGSFDRRAVGAVVDARRRGLAFA